MAKNMNVAKPVRMTLEVIFSDDNRRVVPADLERATRAAGVAFKSTLEAAHPSYKIKSVEVSYEYLYSQAKKVIPLLTKKVLKRAS